MTRMNGRHQSRHGKTRVSGVDRAGQKGLIVIGMVFLLCAYQYGVLWQRHKMILQLEDPLTSPLENNAKSDKDLSFQDNKVVNVKAVAEKWHLTGENAVPLLLKILDKEWDYQPDRDFLVFEHEMKTGGTSVSDVLETAMKDAVLPGSHRSGQFSIKRFETTRDLETNKTTLEEWIKSKKVVFSHTFFRQEGNETKFAQFLRSTIFNGIGQEKRFRLMTMIREPAEKRASAHAMWLCHHSRMLQRALEMKLIDTKNDTDSCHGTNLTFLTDVRMEYEFKPKCEREQHLMSQSKRDACQAFQKNGTDPYPHCRSIQYLVHNTSMYNRWFHNQQQDKTTQTVEEGKDVSDYESGALERLGGLEETNAVDFVWFGVTERMEESLCLFHYNFRLPFLDTPRERFMSCRPISRWSAEDIALVREREVLDDAVHRAANAILDIQLTKMRLEIQARLGQNETLESMPYVSPQCL